MPNAVMPIASLGRALFCLALGLSAPAQVHAQAQVPAGYDVGPTRVLQIESLDGAAAVRRAGKTVALQPGFLLFNEERLMMSPESRAHLLLARYGRLEFLPESGPGALTVQKLPFSSWAVDLETALRVESGALRVRWTRPPQDDEWPLSVRVGRWRAQLGSGEFLFRSAERRAEICSVFGVIEVIDEPAAWRGKVAPGQCVALREGDSAETVALVRADWAAFDAAPATAPAVTAAVPDVLSDKVEERLVLPPVQTAAAVGPAVPVVTAPPALAPVPVQPQTQTSVQLIETKPSVVVQVAEPAPAAAVAPVEAPANVAVAPVPTPALTVAQAPVAAVDAAAPLDSEPTAPEAVATNPPIATPPPPPPAPSADVRPVLSSPGATTSPPPDSAESQSAAQTPGAAKSAVQAPAPAVAAVPAAEEPTGPEWIVNVMTVTDPKVAEEHLQRLTTAGYPALLRSERVRGRSSYRLIIPGLSSDQAANRVVELLKKNLGYVGAWSLQKR